MNNSYMFTNYDSMIEVHVCVCVCVFAVSIYVQESSLSCFPYVVPPFEFKYIQTRDHIDVLKSV